MCCIEEQKYERNKIDYHFFYTRLRTSDVVVAAMSGPLEDIGGNVFAWLRDCEREEAREEYRSAQDEEPEESADERGT